MLGFLYPFKKNKVLWFPLIGILFIGIFSNFIVAGLLLLIYLATSRSFYKTEFLLLIFLSSCILASNLSPNFEFAQTFRFISLGCALVYLLYHIRITKNTGNYILPFALYATLISLLLSPVGMDAVLRGLSFWLVALVIFSFYNRSYFRGSHNIADLLVKFILVFILINIIYIFLPGTTGRFSGVMGNPNELGLFSVFSYGLIHLLQERRETSFSNKEFLILKVAFIFLIILSGSRTSLFGLILYELISRLSQNKPLLLFSSLVIGAFYYLSLSINFIAIIQSLGLSEFFRVDTIATGSGRTEVWEVAWEEIKGSPWFGKGILYDNYFILEYGREYIGYNRPRHWYGIWNSYLSLLLDVGIVGLCAFFFFLFKVFRKSYDKNLALAFLVMAAFGGITESWMASSMNAFTPLFFLYWAIQSQSPEEIVEE